MENATQPSGTCDYYTPCVGYNLIITYEVHIYSPWRKLKNNFIGVLEKNNRPSKLKILATARKREMDKKNELPMSQRQGPREQAGSAMEDEEQVW